MKRILSILSVIAMLMTMCAAIALPAIAETTPFTSIYTVYDAGIWKADGSDVGTASKTTYKSADKITVAEGDKIYFGPCRTNQGFQLYHWDAEGTSTTVKNSSAELAIAGIFDSGDVLYCYTAPKAGEIGLVCYRPYFDFFVIAKNEVITVENFFDYWEAQNSTADFSKITTVPALSTNAFTAVETQGYYKADGTISASSSHYSGELIEVVAGDIIYFGPVNLGQGFQLYDWHGSDAADFSDYTMLTEALVQAGTRVHTVGTFPNGQGILAYEVTETGRVGLVNATANNKMFFATKNVRLTVENLYEYWDLHSNTITDYSSILGRYDNVTPKESVLNGKTALFTGDSICAAAADDDYFNDLGLGGWSGRIAMNYGLAKATNNGVSGAALSNTRDRWYNVDSTSKKQGRIYWQIASESGTLYDYVILHGGTNDAWDSVSAGEISDSFELEDFDLSTYAGGLEATIYYAVNYHPEAAIGYVLNFEMPLKISGNIPTLGETYFELGKKICEKWGIPYLDLYSTLNAETFDTTIYTRDTVHPNAAGYNIIAPYIGEWMETLQPYSEVTKTTEKTVVACVGDSLTKGEYSGDVTRYSYPAYLQEMLGDDYEVLNFGWGGATAQTTTTNVYKDTYQYKESIQYDPDQVIIMLGANDAKSANWDSANAAVSCAAFKAALKALAEEYLALPSNPTVYLAKTPWSTDTFRQTAYTTGGLLAAVEEVADELGLDVIDAYTPTVDKADTLFATDGTHLNAAGYELVAGEVYKVLTESETAPDVLSVTEKDTAVEETNESKPLIRNWKAYYETADAFRIETVEDVEIFGDLISAGYTFAGKTVYLENDLDFTGIKFKPLGASSGKAETQDYTKSFEGVFDGQNHVFSNVYITDYMYSAMGLFPALHGAIIKNFGLDGGLIEGYSVVGGITAYGDYGTQIENVWSSADVFATSSAAGIAGNMRQNGAPEPPKMKNVACYGTISGNTTVYGISSWGQTSSLETEDIVFGGSLFIHTKTSDSSPFVRYGSTGLTGLATGYYAVDTAEQRTVYVDDVTPVLFSANAFANGEFAYYMNNLEGNTTKWITKYGYAVPWGDESTAIRKITVNQKDAYTDENGSLPASLLGNASYWYGTDGLCYSSAAASAWVLEEGDVIRLAISAAGADYDGDSSITTADVVMLLRYIDHRDAEIMTETQADVNADGRIFVYDAVLLLQAIRNMVEM